MWFRAPGVHSESGFYNYAHAHNNLYAIGGRIKSEFSATVSVVLPITTEIYAKIKINISYFMPQS